MSRHLTSRLTVAVAAVISLALQALAFTDISQFNPQSLNEGRPLFFTENKGQWDERVLFKADGVGGLTWYIEQDGFTVLFSVPDSTADPIADPRSLKKPNDMQRLDAIDHYPNKAHALKFKFQNALPRTAGNFLPEQTSSATAASIESSERLSWNNNYFLGNDESKWAPDCGNYQRVVLKDVWPGIDVVWRGEGKHAEFDFVVAPSADASQIQVEVLGLTGEMETNSNGEELFLPTSLGVLRQALPEAFQIEPNGSLSAVRAEFAVKGGNSFGVALPEGHDPAKPLIVDPLVYSTYLGGGGLDCIYALAPDGTDGVVVAGRTWSGDFPTTEGAFDRSLNDTSDAFVARLSGNGELLYSTYLGGSGSEQIYELTSFGEEGVVGVGDTDSDDFPTTDGAYDRSYNGGPWDAVVVGLSADGNVIRYSTFLGGGSWDTGIAIVQDGAGGVVVAGGTWSTDQDGFNRFPTTQGAFDRTYNGGDWDGFVARFSSDGRELIYSTFLGGSGWDDTKSIVSDGGGAVVVAGYTTSEDFPTTEGAFDRSFNDSSDAYVARLNGDGSELLFSTYFGGSDIDYASSIVSDGEGAVVVAGATWSNDFPTSEGAFDRSYNGNRDAFIAKLSGNGSELVYSTYLGGSRREGRWERDFPLALDGAGGIVVTGFTASDNFPTTDGAFDRSFNDSSDAFVARLSGNGELLYSTYFGGNSWDRAYALALDGAGGVFVAGRTLSDDFPTTEEAFDRSYNGNLDAFITRIDIGLEVGGEMEWSQSFGGDREEDCTALLPMPDGGYLVGGWSNSINQNQSRFYVIRTDANGGEIWTRSYRDEYSLKLYSMTQTTDGNIAMLGSMDDPNNANSHDIYFIKINPQGDELVAMQYSAADNQENRAVAATPDGGFVMAGFDSIGDDHSYDMLVSKANPDGHIEWQFNFGGIYEDYGQSVILTPDGGYLIGGYTMVPGHEGYDSVSVYVVKLNSHGGLVWENRYHDRRFAFALKILPAGNDRYALFGFDIPALEDGEGFDFNSYLLMIDGDGGQIFEREYAGDDKQVAYSAVQTPDGGFLMAGGSHMIMEMTPESGDVFLLRINSDGDSLWSQSYPADAGTQIAKCVLRTQSGEYVVAGTVSSESSLEGKDILLLKTAADPVSVQFDKEPFIPERLTLQPAFPNPFNSITTIRYSLPEASSMKLSVRDLTGRKVVVLASGNREAGVHSAIWSADGVGSGLYFVRLETDTKTITQKVLLVK